MGAACGHGPRLLRRFGSSFADGVDPGSGDQAAQSGLDWEGGVHVLKQIELTEATGSLAEYAEHVEQEPVIVTVDGKPIAALLAIDNVDLETASLSTNPQFLALIERSRARQEAEGGISSEEMRRRL